MWTFIRLDNLANIAVVESAGAPTLPGYIFYIHSQISPTLLVTELDGTFAASYVQLNELLFDYAQKHWSSVAKHTVGPCYSESLECGHLILMDVFLRYELYSINSCTLDTSLFRKTDRFSSHSST